MKKQFGVRVCISHAWHGAKYGQNVRNLRIIPPPQDRLINSIVVINQHLQITMKLFLGIKHFVSIYPCVLLKLDC